MKDLFKIIPVIIAAVLIFGALSAYAASPRVVDEADILTELEEERLEAKLDELSEKYSQDIVVVTVMGLGGKDVKLYADDYFDDNGYGYGDTYTGILLLVDMVSRQYAISTCGDAIEIFGESDLDSLEDAFLYDLSNGYYYDAFDAFADECAYIIKYDKRLEPIWLIITLIVGAVIAFLTVNSMTSKHKNVKPQPSANRYMMRNTFRVDRSRDVYLYSHVTRVRRPRDNGGGGSSGRSVSSSGRSHGGRSGSF